MKKIVCSFFLILLSSLSTKLSSTALEHQKDICFTSAFTAGYVFKHDCAFNNVYGPGIVNIITADGCYYPWKHWGVGAKISYWQTNGKTTSFKKHSHVYQVPATLYVRAMKDIKRLQIYASLGGGFTWMSEKSYLGNVHAYKGIGEVEGGLNYHIWDCLNVTTAFRYLFPPQSFNGANGVDIGGCDLRAGIGLSF